MTHPCRRFSLFPACLTRDPRSVSVQDWVTDMLTKVKPAVKKADLPCCNDEATEEAAAAADKAQRERERRTPRSNGGGGGGAAAGMSLAAMMMRPGLDVDSDESEPEASPVRRTRNPLSAKKQIQYGQVPMVVVNQKTFTKIPHFPPAKLRISGLAASLRSSTTHTHTHYTYIHIHTHTYTHIHTHTCAHTATSATRTHAHNPDLSHLCNRALCPWRKLILPCLHCGLFCSSQRVEGDREDAVSPGVVRVRQRRLTCMAALPYPSFQRSHRRGAQDHLP